MGAFFGHIQEFEVRSNEIDLHKKIRITSLVELMQEASMQNVLKLKLSVWDLEQEKLAWVLLKKHLTIYKLPTIGDKLTIKTYPAGFQKIFAYRDYIVYNEAKEVIAKSSTTWALINTATRKSTYIPKYSFYDHLPADLLPRADFRIKPEFKHPIQRMSTIQWSHLDWNGHVSNIHLIKLIINTMSAEYLHQNKMYELKIQFKIEAFLNDTLEVYTEIKSNDIFDHKIVRNNDQKIIALAQTNWKTLNFS